MYAQVRNNSQGVIKVTSGGLAPAADAGVMHIAKETQLSALINGSGQPGMKVLKWAAELAAEKAQRSGVGIVGTNHTATSTGCLAYYAEHLAQQGLVALVLAQSPDYMAPAGVQAHLHSTCIGTAAVLVSAQHESAVLAGLNDDQNFILHTEADCS